MHASVVCKEVTFALPVKLQESGAIAFHLADLGKRPPKSSIYDPQPFLVNQRILNFQVAMRIQEGPMEDMELEK